MKYHLFLWNLRILLIAFKMSCCRYSVVIFFLLIVESSISKKVFRSFLLQEEKAPYISVLHF